MSENDLQTTFCVRLTHMAYMNIYEEDHDTRTNVANRGPRAATAFEAVQGFEARGSRVLARAWQGLGNFPWKPPLALRRVQ